MKFKQILAAVAAALASSGAMAGSLTGNVGVVSDYMFRGVDQTASGAAVQGGFDYGFDFGLYTGLWVSNSVAGGGNEADVYAGYGMKLGPVNLDGGVIFYAYTEDTEATTPGVRTNTDYAEVYVGGAFGPAALKVFYTNAFGRDTGACPSGTCADPDKDALLYTTASVTLGLTDTLSLTPQVGFTMGDGAKDAFGDEYADFSITAVKALKDDLSVSLAVVGTDRDLSANNSDNPKFVIGLKKNFNI